MASSTVRLSHDRKFGRWPLADLLDHLGGSPADLLVPGGYRDGSTAQRGDADDRVAGAAASRTSTMMDLPGTLL